ncbi:MAG TPA: cytochrome c biogenesis protein CcdA [Candidatus Paceibacterota bacterium]
MSKKTLILAAVGTILIIGFAILFKNLSGSGEWLWNISRNGSFLLPLVAVSALIDSINPCAFSVLIVSIVFLFGLGKSREKIFSYGISYILGIFAVYLLIGLGILQVLHLFNVPHFMSKLAAILLIIFGAINILETIFPGFPIKFSIPHVAHAKMNILLEKATFPAMFVLGAIVGLCEFPCTGGPYLTVLGLLHDTKTYLSGAGYLLLYNLIFVLPLILILAIAGNKFLTDKIKNFQKTNIRSMKIVAGLLMIILAFVILNL